MRASEDGEVQEPTFRFSDLAFQEADRGKYDQLQQLTTTLKQNHTKYINTSVTDAKKQYNQPHCKPLDLAFNAQREYYHNYQPV